MRSIIAYSFLIALLLLPVLSLYLWQRQPAHKLDIAIIDKTVLPTGKTKHTPICWVLKHHNFRKANGMPYQTSVDYFGLFPAEDSTADMRIKDLQNNDLQFIDSLANATDVLYCADTYGTYYNEWYPDSVPTTKPLNLYGGLCFEDLYLLEKIKSQGKLVIAENGMLSPPTLPKVRLLAEKELGIRWSGWSGCYFSSLDTAINKDIPRWALDLQRQQYLGGWIYTQSGIIMVHESGKILILEHGNELARAVPTIYATQYCRQQYGTAGSVHFPYWFEIVEPIGEGNTVIANFTIHTNPIGDSLLKMYAIPSEFPAVIEHRSSYWMHYYAGDFSALHIKQSSASFWGIEKIDAILYDGADHSGEKFFWTFYRPLLSGLLKKYSERPPFLSTDSLQIKTTAL